MTGVGPENNTAIRFDNVSYTYEDGTAALDNVSFSIDYGESVGIIGHNGSGKTSLLLHIVGIILPGGGVTVAGHPVTRSSLKEVRKRVGFVFQDPRDQLFMTTVYEDVAFGPLNAGMTPDEALGRADDVLAAVGMEGQGNRVPYHLSGGEMRRVSIAAAMALSPEILVMDEPSSGLDPRSRREIAALIRSLSGTKLVTSHDLDFMRACTDRTILLYRGRVVADGPTANILNDATLLEQNGL